MLYPVELRVLLKSGKLCMVGNTRQLVCPEDLSSQKGVRKMGIAPINMNPRSFLDLRFPEFVQALKRAGLRNEEASAAWRELHRGQWEDGTETPDVPVALNGLIPDRELPHVREEVVSEDGWTRKFLLELGDGETIETVLMGYAGRFTVCASTHAGCAMGCAFCATGQRGFKRHLSAAEIVGQVLFIRRMLVAEGRSGPRNLVLMGMGEPLHNYEAVMTALEILSDTRGANIGPRRITISTVGLVPGILRMAAEKRPYNLAVSLHGVTEEQRRPLVPVSQRWPLGELIEACRRYASETGRRIFFEWTLIAGKNDSPETAARLAELLFGIPAHVNLIPLNPTVGFDGSPASASAAAAFQTALRKAGIPSTVRQRRGIDVRAGCGQLV
jgi:23S rRNA (adenine2503-C2)-methyltransferase